MKKRKIVVISIVAILVAAVLIASYVILIMPKVGEESIEEVAKVNEGERLEGGTGSTSGWDLERVDIVYDTENIPVPVPKGYVASSVDGEHTVNEGFVIYEGTDEVNNSNKDTAQKTRNQWVWVPVEDSSEIYGTDSSGMKHGKLYNFDSNGRTACNWTESNGVMSISNSSNYKEPDIVTSYDNDNTLPKYILKETRGGIYDELKEEFDKTIESIEKYGGFYIGRYETGGLNGNAKVVKGDTNISDQTWYTMYKKSKTLNGTNENVRTSMIWGCMWDATLEWLVDSGSKTYSEVGSDSTSWGNYYYSTFSYTNSSGGTSTKSSGSQTRIPAGSAEYTKANNIYDMAGNVLEWTLETYGTGYRVLHGGYCFYHGSNSPADNRNYGYPNNSDTYYRR